MSNFTDNGFKDDDAVLFADLIEVRQTDIAIGQFIRCVVNSMDNDLLCLPIYSQKSKSLREVILSNNQFAERAGIEFGRALGNLNSPSNVNLRGRNENKYYIEE